MMLPKSSSCLKLIKQICLIRDSVIFSCEYCVLHYLDCFVMISDPDFKSKPKCDKCTCYDHLCVSVLWKSLD